MQWLRYYRVLPFCLTAGKSEELEFLSLDVRRGLTFQRPRERLPVRESDAWEFSRADAGESILVVPVMV